MSRSLFSFVLVLLSEAVLMMNCLAPACSLVYDPRNVTMGRLRSRTRTSTSPMGYRDERVKYEEEDDVMSVTTYTNNQSQSYKTRSNGSSARRREWEYQGM